MNQPYPPINYPYPSSSQVYPPSSHACVSIEQSCISIEKSCVSTIYVMQNTYIVLFKNSRKQDGPIILARQMYPNNLKKFMNQYKEGHINQIGAYPLIWNTTD